MNNTFQVEFSKKALKELKKIPLSIVLRLQAWIEGVCNYGLNETRKIPGYHDEPLQGKRQGQRSIRINKSYRAIYQTKKDGIVEFIEIIEVNKHDY